MKNIEVREDKKTLTPFEQETAYYKEYPDDKDIKDLDTLIGKIADEFACVYLCLDYIRRLLRNKRIGIIRGISAVREIRNHKGLLNNCISDLKNTLNCFDTVGTVVNSLYTQGTVKFCRETYEEAKSEMNKISSIDPAQFDNRNEKEKKDDEVFIKKCIDTYLEFLYDVRVFNEKIAEFNKGKAKEEQLPLIESANEPFQEMATSCHPKQHGGKRP